MRNYILVALAGFLIPATPSLAAGGTVTIGGGGSAYNGQLLESYIDKNQLKLENDSPIKSDVLNRLEVLRDTVPQLREKLLQILSRKKFILTDDAHLAAMSNNNPGVIHPAGNHLLGFQDNNNIWLSRNYFKNASPEQRTDLLMHELIVGITLHLNTYMDERGYNATPQALSDFKKDAVIQFNLQLKKISKNPNTMDVNLIRRLSYLGLNVRPGFSKLSEQEFQTGFDLFLKNRAEICQSRKQFNLLSPLARNNANLKILSLWDNFIGKNLQQDSADHNYIDTRMFNRPELILKHPESDLGLRLNFLNALKIMPNIHFQESGRAFYSTGSALHTLDYNNLANLICAEDFPEKFKAKLNEPITPIKTSLPSQEKIEEDSTAATG